MTYYLLYILNCQKICIHRHTLSSVLTYRVMQAADEYKDGKLWPIHSYVFLIKHNFNTLV